MQKTNAIRILDKEKISYEVFEYSSELTNGIIIAETLKEDKSKVFKTLVSVANTKEYFVFVIPVEKTLDLKKCAKIANVKSIEMIKQKDLLGLTGYIHGGCSPIAMKKQFKTFVHNTAETFDKFYISAGRVGMQLLVNPNDVKRLTNFCYADLIIEEN